MSIICEEYYNLINLLNAYGGVRKHFDDLIEFLKGYNDIVKDHIKKLKLFIKKQMVKIDYLTNCNDFNLSFITSKIGLVVQSQILAYEQISVGIEGILKNSADFFKDQEQCQLNSKKQFEDAKNDLIEKYKKVEKNKISFFTNATSSENILIKIQKMKKQNQFNDINEDISLKYALTESLKKTKISEKEYKDQIKLTKSFEDSFLSGIEEGYNVTQVVAKEIIENIKTGTVNAMVLIKNALKLILMEEEMQMPSILECEVKDKFDEFLNSIRLTGKKPFKNITPRLYKIVILDKFKKHNQVDINNQEDDNYSNNNYLLNCNREPVQSFDSLTFEDIHQIVKTLYNNISLKDSNGYNIEIEGNKIFILQICDRLLIKEETHVQEKTIEQVKTLLKNKIYRKLFLQKLNDLRSKGVFKIEIKNFQIIGELLNLILTQSSNDDDFFSLKNLIILSQTFYCQQPREDANGNKLYLQNIIQRNVILQTKDFWEKFISYSIMFEINESIASDKKNNNVFKESEKESKTKFANIVFAQLLALSDNMIEFGVDKVIGRDIVEPIMNYYNINKENQEVIFLVLEKERTPQINIEEFFKEIDKGKGGMVEEEKKTKTIKNEKKDVFYDNIKDDV